MSNYTRDLSNLSYTNKDFGEIYPELLDLAKKISYKWDPSLSDESDPGVVLLKLAALMADKCNYNIDKNILELFPLSVTQLANARQIFDQCGYTMRYYESATTDLSLQMIHEPDITEKDVIALLGEGVTLDPNTVKVDSNGDYLRRYTIPRFTMFSDVDNSVVYTAIEDAIIYSDGTVEKVPVIQGAVNTYSVNGTTTITADMLDSNRRIYFTELNIPENGIFISNVGSADCWQKSDNLLLEALGTPCYKFGLTLDGMRCYVEFPTDIDALIGNGITINYVLTSGTDGNVRKKFLSQIFANTDDRKITRKIGSSLLEQDTDLTTDNIRIWNEYGAVNGKNPETIDQAYSNYQRVKTTFETLVSTKDYTDFLISNRDVSNCVVCDRSDDIQSAYSVLTKDENEDDKYVLIPHTIKRAKKVETLAEVSTDGGETWSKEYEGLARYSVTEPEMTAFDLRVYGLKYVGGFDDDREYDTTYGSDYKRFSSSFDVVPSQAYSSIGHLSDVKCLPHDYKAFEEDRIIILKNRYPIVAKVASPYKLTYAQQEEILGRIKLNLFNLLNSQVLKFGEEVDYNKVYDTILKSDPRISGVILDEIKYETYAVYLSSWSHAIETLRIDASSVPPDDTNLERKQILNDLWNRFRTEVYARSVLSGKTPLFIRDGSFVYSIAHERAENGDSKYEVEKMGSSVDIPLTYNGGYTLTTRELKKNDVITLTSPNLIMDKRYANYVQFVTNIGCSRLDARPEYDDTSDPIVIIEKNEDYVLQPNEYIIFFWRTSEDPNESYTYVKYTGRKSAPTIICPSFTMTVQPNTANLSNIIYSIDDSTFLTLGDTTTDYSDGIQLTIPRSVMYTHGRWADYTLVSQEYRITDNESLPVEQQYSAPPAISLNDLINRYFIGERFNLKSNTIETKKINRIHLTSDSSGTNKFYWILNSVVDGHYRLFGAASTTSPNEEEYILKEGEQLIYSNDRATQLYVLGAGTKIIRRKKDSDTTAICGVWEVPALENKLEFLGEGPEYFDDPKHSWFNIRKQASKFELDAIEMTYRKLGEKTRLSIHLPSSQGSGLELEGAKYFIDSNGVNTNVGTDTGYHANLVSYTITNELGEQEVLPVRNHPELKWDVSSSLNLNMSATSPMRLYANQRVRWLPVGAYNWIEVEGSDVEEFYIQSSTPITKSGGTNLDVRRYDILEEVYKPNEIYIYELKDVNLSSSADTNNYDLPWQFDQKEITVSGRDVTLTNISLPSGNYILPVEMKDVNFPVLVYWTDLRKLKAFQLTDDEKYDLGKIQLVNNYSVHQEDSSDWNNARRPVELSDVAKWLYSSILIDVSDEFQNETIASAFSKMFYTLDTVVQDPEADTTGNFQRRYDADSLASRDLLNMLVNYGGKKFTSAFEQNLQLQCGDLIAVRVSQEPESGLPTYVYQIWAYLPVSNPEISSAGPFIKIEYGPGRNTPICQRESSIDLSNATYFYQLRPDNVAGGKTGSRDRDKLAWTVTGATPYKNGTYYYMLSCSDSNNFRYNLRLECCTGDGDVNEDTVWPSYTIGNLLKYTRPKLTEDSSEEIPFFYDVLNRISEMDVDSIFNYTYDVPDSDLVMYPLESISFVDSNHPLNRFTICQYTMNESKTRNDIVVAGKYR